MARIRTIKPEFFTSEDIVSLSPMARLLYIALWCEADREGRLIWKPKTFKLRYLPADVCDADALCDELVNQGLVNLYGDGLAFIPSFTDHQHLNPRESQSSLPDPVTGDARVPTRRDASNLDVHAQGGREGKGREGDKDASPRDTSSADADLFPNIPPAVVADFRKLRTAKKAPITKTAVDGIAREAGKAGLTLESALRICCERGWTGFKAEWVTKDQANPNAARPGGGRREL